MNKKRDTFNLLLRRGASVKGISGERALLYAAGDGERDMVLRLLERGVNANCRDVSQGDTPLMKTAFEGDVVLAQILIRHKAKLDLQDTLGRTALTWAVIGDNETMARILLDRGAKVDAKLLNGNTELTLAIRNGLRSTVRLLLEHGATITPLDRQAAREFEDEKILSLLAGPR